MPIRFRCAYCNQLMGIARRKAGTVVRCPKCDQELTVPDPSPGDEDDGPAAPEPAPAPPQVFAPPPTPVKPPKPGPKPAKGPSAGPIFEESDFSEFLEKKPPGPQLASAPQAPRGGNPMPAMASMEGPISMIDVEMVPLPENRGILLTPVLLTIVGVAFVLLLGLAFFIGMLVGQHLEM